MNIEPTSCDATASWYQKLVCLVHGKVEWLCNTKEDGSFSVWNKIGAGFWQVLSYGTPCNCCHAFRVLFLLFVSWLVGAGLPWYVGVVLSVLLWGIALYAGDKFEKEKK